jgi:predicted outer membrane lipoprotein
MRKLARLFVIKNRIEAFAIIYALALGGAERGRHYLEIYPGATGRALFVAALVAVFMAAAKILDALTYERQKPKMD